MSLPIKESNDRFLNTRTDFWGDLDQYQDYLSLLHFDIEHYLELYPDVKNSGLNPIEHFVNFGVFENRIPSSHFNNIVRLINNTFDLEPPLSLANFYYPDVYLRNLTSEFINIQCRNFIQKMFYEPHYEQQTGLIFNDEDSAIDHFISVGLKRGISPTPLFNVNYYLARVKDKIGFVSFSREQFFLHWLIIGNALDLIFTPLYKEDKYKRLYKDLQGNIRIKLFEHAIYHGVKENRTIAEAFDIHWYLTVNKLPNNTPALLHYLTFRTKDTAFNSSIYCKNIPAIDEEASSLENYLSIYNAEIQLLESDIYKELLAQAEHIEPAINTSLQDRTLLIPGLTHAANVLCSLASRVRQSLGAKKFDFVVTIPHCRMSGAARVAAALCHGLCQLTEPSKILLVRTDGNEMLKPEWFPESITSINLNQFFGIETEDVRIRILIDLLRGVSCRNFINVNSRLAWLAIAKFGSQLSTFMSISSYFFCWDRDVNGKRVGYPEKFFNNTFNWLTNIFVDSNYLRNQLIEQYRIPQSLANKIIVLHTPVTSTSNCNFTDIRKMVPISNKKPVIFWGGRLDRQKRFDLVVDIARNNSRFEIWFWGKSVIDFEIDMTTLPNNLLYKGEYQYFTELPFLHCDLWLYTSEWDGIPTLLLDVAAFGIPLVSANIEGITDLLTAENSWPVTDNLNPQAYVEQIDLLLADPDASKKKISRLQCDVKTHHNLKQFVSLLKSSFHDCNQQKI